MITSKDELFIMIGYSFLDSAYRRQVDPAVLMVYLDLRRYVWRGHRKVHKRVEELVNQDWLVSFVGQEKLASRNGLSTRHLQRVLDRLKSMKWIETQDTGRGLIYILGKKISTEIDDLKHIGELFFADSMIRSAVKEEGEVRYDTHVGSEVRYDTHVGSDTTHTSDQIRHPRRTEVDSKELHNGKEPIDSSQDTDDLSKDQDVGEVIQLPTPTHGDGLTSAADSDAIARRVECAQAVELGAETNLEAVKRWDLKRRGELAKKKSGRSRKASEVGEDGGESKVKIDSKDVENWFRDAMSKKFGSGKTKVKWYPKERKLALNLLDQYGPELVEKTVVYFVKNWDDISTRKEIDAPFPTINILHGYRDNIFGEVMIGKPKRRSVDRLRGEYDSESASRSPAHGWGDLAKRPGD